jgi:hypothetical protein
MNTENIDATIKVIANEIIKNIDENVNCQVYLLNNDVTELKMYVNGKLETFNQDDYKSHDNYINSQVENKENILKVDSNDKEEYYGYYRNKDNILEYGKDMNFNGKDDDDIYYKITVFNNYIKGIVAEDHLDPKLLTEFRNIEEIYWEYRSDDLLYNIFKNNKINKCFGCFGNNILNMKTLKFFKNNFTYENGTIQINKSISHPHPDRNKYINNSLVRFTTIAKINENDKMKKTNVRISVLLYFNDEKFEYITHSVEYNITDITSKVQTYYGLDQTSNIDLGLILISKELNSHILHQVIPTKVCVHKKTQICKI